MGLIQKIKDFGSKIIHGVKKGWEVVRDKVAPFLRKALPIAKTAASGAAAAFGHPELIPTIEKGGAVADRILGLIK